LLVSAPAFPNEEVHSGAIRSADGPRSSPLNKQERISK
jgi:hypothetical protein